MGCEVAVSSSTIAGPVFRRKPVRDAICLPFHLSQRFAHELAVASFISLVLFQQDEILEDATHLSQHSHTLAPCLHEMGTESRKERYSSCTKVIPYARFTCKCASHIKMLPLP